MVERTLPPPAAPCALVFFGAAGDLAKRKLFPSLVHLADEGLLPEDLAIVGVDIAELDDNTFREKQTEQIADFLGEAPDADLWKGLCDRMTYVQGDFRDDGLFERLKGRLAEADENQGTRGDYLFYLAVPPRFIGGIIDHLGKSKLVHEPDGHWRRVVIEKPFGHDFDSAVALNAQIHQSLAEHQIFRIDHYLGKETVQNILAFRFTSSMFEPIWNRGHVDHVQITVSEDLGVERRAGYYEHAGALRDMVPSHLFQVLSFIAMEPPTSFDADAVRSEKSKVLHAIQPMAPDAVLTRAVRGQYGRGTRGKEHVAAYREEPGVAPDSRTETFVAMRLDIDNWRWADVPFYLRTGKRLSKRYSEVMIEFKRAPMTLFRHAGIDSLPSNQLILRIQPDEGISLRFGAKIPGPDVQLGTVDMDFSYAENFGVEPSTGYETLLYDAMTGASTLFQRADNVELAWQKVAPMLDVWGALPPRDFPNYASGSMGPDAANDLLRQDGRSWRVAE